MITITSQQWLDYLTYAAFALFCLLLFLVFVCCIFCGDKSNSGKKFDKLPTQSDRQKANSDYNQDYYP